MIFGQNSGILGLKKNVCPLETSIYILFLIDLLIPVDEQRQVDIFRQRNFAIWSIGTKVMLVLVKKIEDFAIFKLKSPKLMILM